VAAALAALGEVERAEAIVGKVAANDPQQYAGRAAATVASAHAKRGEIDLAMGRLRELDGETALDTAWWRTRGYVTLAGQKSLSRDRRLEALRAARRSADGVVGSRRVTLLEMIAEEFHALGEPGSASEVLEAVELVVLDAAMKSPTGAARVATLARSWHSIDRPEHARALLQKAEGLVKRGMNIEQPLLYAKVASGFMLLGDGDEARRLFSRAFTISETLENARPRALAVVAVLLSMGRGKTPLDNRTRARLEALYDGLKAPW
jgi:hypothetical protein